MVVEQSLCRGCQALPLHFVQGKFYNPSVIEFITLTRKTDHSFNKLAQQPHSSWYVIAKPAFFAG